MKSTLTVKNDSHRPEIHSGVILAPTHHFGSHVQRRASQHALFVPWWHVLGEAKVWHWIRMQHPIQSEVGFHTNKFVCILSYLLIWGLSHTAKCSVVSNPNGRYFGHVRTGENMLWVEATCIVHMAIPNQMKYKVQRWVSWPICCRKRRATLSGKIRRLRMKRDRSPPGHHSRIR